MKKMTSILIAVLMLVSLSATALAADTQNTEISMTVDPSMESYTLTIPATVQIDPTVKTGEIDVVLSDVTLLWNTFLTVYATSANHIDGEDGSYLVNTANNTQKIAYSVFGECAGDTSFEATTQGIYAAVYNTAYEWRGTSYPARNDDGTITLTVDGDIPGSGTYTDTLTFSVELQTLADRYDRQDRDITLEEAWNFYSLVDTEYHEAIDNGTFKIVEDASEAESGEKYVLQTDATQYQNAEASYITWLEALESKANNGEDIQIELNNVYYTMEAEWKAFWSTKIHRKA